MMYGTILFKLKELLESRKVSLQELSEQSGIELWILEHYYHNTVQELDLDVLIMLCYCLCCKIHELVEYQA